MPVFSRAACPTSSALNGRLRSEPIRRCSLSTLARMAMRPQGWWQTQATALARPDWITALLTMKTTFWRSTRFFERQRSSREPFRPWTQSAHTRVQALSITCRIWHSRSWRNDGKRDAASINRGFLNWLARRTESERPFFAFLNYYDAHAPYRLPQGATHRFGRKPRTQDELQIVNDRWDLVDKQTLPRHYLTLGRDAYDNCLAYLDEQLGNLVSELQRRGVLDRTLVVITSDHGEGLGGT